MKNNNRTTKNEINELSNFDITTLNFEKGNGLIPTIIQDATGTVISLVYSNKESVEKSLATGYVWRYSRKEKKVLKKGATSKNTQRIVSVSTDCDEDALLYTVQQNGTGGCHTGEYSCFPSKPRFSLQELFDTILSRKDNAPVNSYTRKLFEDDKLLKRKLIEEATELVLAETKEEIVWEAADLLYFTFARLAQQGVTLTDIEKENERRNKEGDPRRANTRTQKNESTPQGGD